MPETSPASKTSTCHKTVRSGTIYDFDMQERRRESLERAEKLKAELGDEPITGTDDRIAYRFVKRVFDFAFSAAVLVLLSWLFVIIAILVKVDDPKGPVFFKQTRVGKNGREFEMLKFRSMCVDAEEKLADLKELNEKTGPVFKIAEDPRITRVGKWLRKLSLDELPQFINVLRSDIPLRILKTRPEFSEKSMGAFALPAKSSTNKGKVFSQVVSCFANGLRMRRISKFNCNRIRGMEAQFLAKPVFGAVCA
ncbi:sugar transferase [Senegalimassilia anaerobia]|uniref:sugar transferase n=1 Tax=Senegalimassilia anaerobia TaxID=1473216 RepID=UPI003A954483